MQYRRSFRSICLLSSKTPQSAGHYLLLAKRMATAATAGAPAAAAAAAAGAGAALAAPCLSGQDLLGASRCLSLHNGVKLPLMGLGTWRLRGDRLKNGVWGALSEGYGLIDTAAVYGNEQEIKQLLEDAGNPRVFLTSKLQPKDAKGTESVIKAFEETLQRLGRQQLDLYLIHWPGSAGVAVDSAENRKLRLESWRALEKLYRDNKVRAIGVSNFLPQHIEHLMEDGAEIVPMVNQLEWQPLCWVPSLLPIARKHQITLQAYSSLGSGRDLLLQHPVINQIARETNKPASAVLLRWPLQQGLAVIPCSTSHEHLRENKEALDFELSESQMERINNLMKDAQHRLCWDPNTIA